jgi:hypothetical protein
MSALVMLDPAVETDADADLDSFFLGRLATLVARLAATSSPSERVVLSQAAFSILLDCQDLGLNDAAQAILAQFRAEPLLAGQAVA